MCQRVCGKKKDGGEVRARGGEEKLQTLMLLRPAESLQMAQASAEKLEHTGPAEKERVAVGKNSYSTATKRAVGKNARPTFAKGKTNRAISPDHQIMSCERVQMTESHILMRERRVRGEHREERVSSTLEDGGFQGVEGASTEHHLGEVGTSMSG